MKGEVKLGPVVSLRGSGARDERSSEAGCSTEAEG